MFNLTVLLQWHDGGGALCRRAFERSWLAARRQECTCKLSLDFVLSGGRLGIAGGRDGALFHHQKTVGEIDRERNMLLHKEHCCCCCCVQCPKHIADAVHLHRLHAFSYFVRKYQFWCNEERARNQKHLL